jgi:hypothetical protein
MTYNLNLIQKMIITLSYLALENIYLLSLSISKFYFISIYEKNNILVSISYITAITQLLIFIIRIAIILYNYFHDNDLTKNINHIIFLFLIIGFINFIIFSSLSINDINNFYNDNLYITMIIDNYSMILFLLIRNIINMLYDYDLLL